MDKGKKLAKALGKKLEENVILKELTTLRVGGVADFFYQAETIDELVKAVLACWKIGMPCFVLGNGSNIIVSDFGFPGLVIKNCTSNISLMPDKGQVIADSGVPLSLVIMKSASQELSGLEPLFFIPGTVGGAVYTNAGAHGVEIGSFVKSITALMPSEKIVRLNQNLMQFSYRNWRFKKIKSAKKPVILSVKLQLAHSKREDISQRLAQFKNWRQHHQPLGELSAGSIFKNPSGNFSTTLSEKEVNAQKTAGYLIEQAGGKKMRAGGAAVSKKHANFFINKGKANARDFRQLIEEVREKVRQQSGILLEEEIEYMGHW